MKKVLRLLCTVLCVVLVCAQPSSAFTKDGWTTIPTYEKRQDYIIDHGESVRYLTDMYFSLSDAQETRTAVTLKYKSLLTEESAPFSPTSALTKGQLAKILYSTAAEFDPELVLNDGEVQYFNETVDEQMQSILQFVLSREILFVKGTGDFGLTDRMTLKEAVEALDAFLSLAPDFAPVRVEIPEPEIAIDVVPEKTAYLTFDDKVSENTVRILDILKERNIKAAFFVCSKGDPEILKRIVDEGHVLGNHGMSHNYSIIYSNPDAFWADMEAQAVYLEETVGVRPTLMRFPGGSNNNVSKSYCTEYYIMPTLVAQAADHGYTYMDWNCSNGDAQGSLVPASTLVANALNTARNKDRVILLMHHTKPKTTTPDALPAIIDDLEAEGYVFRTPNPEEFNNQFLKAPTE